MCILSDLFAYSDLIVLLAFNLIELYSVLTSLFFQSVVQSLDFTVAIIMEYGSAPYVGMALK